MPSPTSDALALPDVNVLVALLHPNHSHHLLAQSWWEDTAAFATTPVTECGFVRIALNPTVMGRRVPPPAVIASLSSLRDDRRAVFLPDDASLGAPQVDLSGLSGHRQVTDLHLVDLAARSSAVLVTFDRAVPQTLIPADRRHVRLIG
jgi:uncharacterized protein